MSWIAALLIITSAFMHASWNFVSKRHSPTLAFFFIAAASAALVALPVLFLHGQALSYIPPLVWVLIVATGGAQAVYFSGLAGAYRYGDLSLVYPLARALPVLAVAAISLIAGIGGEIGRIGLLGMLFISAGCLILPLPSFQRLNLRDYAGIVTLMAVLAAAGTTAYTLIDDSALRQLRAVNGISLSSTEITLLFIALQAISTTLMLGLVALIKKSERQQLVLIARSRRLLLSGMLTGVVIMATYGLVLASMAYVRNVSYVAAFRQLSIPIGAVLGLTLQHEARYRPKLAGIAVISLGLILVGLG
jgi:drug/metabolite transporter (DMT)-like permease